MIFFNPGFANLGANPNNKDNLIFQLGRRRFFLNNWTRFRTVII